MFAAVDQHRMFFERGGMMDAMRQYIISVTAAAILCGIVKGIHFGDGASGALIRLIAGIFLALVVVSPLSGIRIEDFLTCTRDYSLAGDTAAALGEDAAIEAMASVIKSNTEAYILDKAAAMEAALAVEVTLSDELPPVPVEVRLSGDISPYIKTRLQSILEDDLGISKENQIWTG
jgi:hypothetical protein